MGWMKVKLLLLLDTLKNMVNTINTLICRFLCAPATGMLMRFDCLELKNFYFVNPQWLCNVFTHVVLSADQSKF